MYDATTVWRCGVFNAAFVCGDAHTRPSCLRKSFGSSDELSGLLNLQRILMLFNSKTRTH